MIAVLTTRRAALVVAFALVLHSATGAALAQGEESAGPELTARAWALTDAQSGEYLAGENAEERLPMASTTKVMVALVAFGGRISTRRSPSRRRRRPSRPPPTATSVSFRGTS